MFCIKAALLPTASSYSDAVALYEKLKPLKNDSTRKALRANARDATATARRTASGEVHFYFHTTPLVQWVSPTQLIVEEYNSPSSTVFINQFLPRGLSCYSRHGYQTINGLATKSAWVFNNVAGVWQPEAECLDVRSTWSIDRKVSARVRKLYKPFFEYARSRAALEGLNGYPGFGITYESMAEAVQHAFTPTGPAPEKWPFLYKTLGATVFWDELPTALTVLHGGVKTVELPPGEVPRPNRNKHLFERLISSCDSSIFLR